MVHSPSTKLIPILLCMGISLFSCTTMASGEPAAESPNGQSTQADAMEKPLPATGLYKTPAKDELVISYLSDSSISFDPHRSYTTTEAQLFTGLYEGLVSYHPLTMEPIPGVAKNWDISADKMTYTFHLRSNAFFWNGEPVTAEDFRATWLRLLDPQVKAEYSFLFDVVKGARDYRTGKNTDPASVGITVSDSQTLVVQLESPAAHFLKILAHHAFSPIYKSLRGKDVWKDDGPVMGNGPYFISSWDKKTMVLAANKFYWDSKNVKVPVIRVIFDDDPDAMVDAYNANAIHWVTSGLDYSSLEDKDSYIVNSLFSTFYLFFRTNDGPLKDTRVRSALTQLIPWNAIRKEQYFPTAQLVPEIPYYPKVDGIAETNIEGALKLLETAGYPEGKGLPTLKIKLSQGYENERIANLIADAWRRNLQCTVEISLLPWSEYNSSLKDGGFALGSTTWIGDFADPLSFLQMWTEESNLNDARYSDPVFEKLIAESMNLSGQERYRKLSEAESRLLNDAVVLPIGNYPGVNIINVNDVGGWFANPLDIHPFKYLFFSYQRVRPGIVDFQSSESVESFKSASL